MASPVLPAWMPQMKCCDELVIVGITKQKREVVGGKRHSAWLKDSIQPSKNLASKPMVAEAGGSEARYFSRTMDGNGPVQTLRGNSGWREFVLPFDPTGAVNPPSRLELNVVLPDGGQVWLRNVKLVQPVPGAFAWTANPKAAFKPVALTIFIGGALMAMALAASKRGHGRLPAMLCAIGTIVAGGVLMSGVLLFSMGRLWAWAAVAGLSGVMLCAAGIWLVARIPRRHREAEWQRMQAADA